MATGNSGQPAMVAKKHTGLRKPLCIGFPYQEIPKEETLLTFPEK